MLYLQTIHDNTPTLAVIDPRGMVARAVQYDCAGAAGTADTLIDRTVHDAAGRTIELWDTRLFESALAPSNLNNVYSLSGVILASNSVDAGLRNSLFGEAGQSVQGWDGRGSQRWMRYDEQLRLSELYEQAAGGDAVIAEHLTYAANDQAFADHNQCGRLIRHEDPAGVLLFNDYGLNGAAIEQERRFTSQKTDRYVTRSRFSPSGELRAQTDARGNEQRFHQTLDGTLRAVDLRLNYSPEFLPIVRTTAYNAHGLVEQEVAGNGVITTLEYGPEDGRLKRLLSRLDDNAPLQDLRYIYDPVGNVLSIEDAALPIRFFANQRIEPISRYRYDTLYRLVEATGWEASAVKHGPSASQTVDPAMPCNYRQTYRYDAGNNLLELTHLGAQDPGHRLVAEAHSNRCLPALNGVEPTENDFRNGFDANGNLLQLQPGQTLNWNMRNQLREVRPVERNGVDDDIERYEYGADGMRVRKIRSLQTHTQTNIIETRYLPCLQIRTHSGTGEELHLIEVQTGRGSVRVLHWKSEPPTGIPNNQQRYNLTDHLGSSTLELDQGANIITQERYYPFGGTAWSNGETVQVSYKTARYSGKEQDATGFYHYGLRYYAQWLWRWLNPDPAGYKDGANVFSFVNGNPLRYTDHRGAKGIDINALTSDQRKTIGLDGPQRAPALELYEAGIEFDTAPFTVHEEVDADIFASLQHAHTTNLVTKMFIVDGAPNQVIDLWRARKPTGSLLKSLGVVRRVKSENNRLAAILVAGVGNCTEHSCVSFNILASAQTKEPIFRVSAGRGVNHKFNVIGDYRELSLDKLVIVDPWAVFPQAHLADIGEFEIGNILDSASADADPKYQLDDRFLIVNSKVVFPDTPPAERMAEIVARPKMWLQSFSTQSDYRSMDYMSEGRNGHFNELPEKFVRDRVKSYSGYIAA